jgi:hypothetical protein
MRISKMAVGTLFLLAVVFASLAFAQNKPAAGAAPAQQGIMGVTMAQVKPGMGLEWESYMKRDLVPALKKAGMKWMGVMKTNGFGVSDSYIISVPLQNVTQFDGPDPFEKALGIDGQVVLMSNIKRCVANARTFMLMERPDLGIAPKPDYAFKMGVMVTLSVAPGRTEEFEKNTKALVAVIGKTNAKAVLAGKTALGGNPNDYYMFIAFDSFADLGNFVPALAKVMAEAKLVPETGIVVHQELATYHMAPELSIQ